MQAASSHNARLIFTFTKAAMGNFEEKLFSSGDTRYIV
jgi:hypothetical protein